jgi:hypothetical protein
MSPAAAFVIAAIIFLFVTVFALALAIYAYLSHRKD